VAGFIVTGGTGALGREVVRAVLARGDSAAVPYRGEEGWEALHKETQAPGRLFGASVDLADAGAAARFVETAAAQLAGAGGLGGVAAIAGAYAGSGTLSEAAETDWPRMMRANLDSAYSIARAALPHLRKSRGAMVFVGSKLVEAGGAGSAAYVVSKAGVVALTRVLAVENKGTGVRVNCVLPGTIDTPKNREGMPKADRKGWTPPEAIATVILFLLSAASAPVTGAVVPVDAPV
jgi:NAD(P)-dependent dehydrogenase (short-subunit alcohol dehydrogenase family)